jgi:hypothetical protein
MDRAGGAIQLRAAGGSGFKPFGLRPFTVAVLMSSADDDRLSCGTFKQRYRKQEARENLGSGHGESRLDGDHSFHGPIRSGARIGRFGIRRASFWREERFRAFKSLRIIRVRLRRQPPNGRRSGATRNSTGRILFAETSISSMRRMPVTDSFRSASKACRGQRMRMTEDLP